MGRRATHSTWFFYTISRCKAASLTVSFSSALGYNCWCSPIGSERSLPIPGRLHFCGACLPTHQPKPILQADPFAVQYTRDSGVCRLGQSRGAAGTAAPLGCPRSGDRVAPTAVGVVMPDIDEAASEQIWGVSPMRSCSREATPVRLIVGLCAGAREVTRCSRAVMVKPRQSPVSWNFFREPQFRRTDNSVLHCLSHPRATSIRVWGAAAFLSTARMLNGIV